MIMTSLSLFWLPSRTLCGTFRAPIISAALAFAGCSWPRGRPWASATGLRPSNGAGRRYLRRYAPERLNEPSYWGTTRLVEFGARPKGRGWDGNSMLGGSTSFGPDVPALRVHCSAYGTRP